jgi:hypothetical protein
MQIKTDTTTQLLAWPRSRILTIQMLMWILTIQMLMWTWGKLSFTAPGNIKWCRHSERQFGGFLPRVLPKELKTCVCTKTCMQMFTVASITAKS